MPVTETHVPKICQQKGRNRAFVRLDGKTIYLGRWGSAQSRQAYDQIIREWLDNGRSLPERVTVSPASPDGGTIDTIDMLCADYPSYIASQDRVGRTYLRPKEWLRMSVLNVARVGKFSSDRAIREYCEKIWQVNPVDID